MSISQLFVSFVILLYGIYVKTKLGLNVRRLISNTRENDYEKKRIMLLRINGVIGVIVVCYLLRAIFSVIAVTDLLGKTNLLNDFPLFALHTFSSWIPTVIPVRTRMYTPTHFYIP